MPSTQESPYVFDYLQLRKTAGIIGVALPVALTVGNLLLADRNLHCYLASSISSYYYTPVRGILVGSLWVIGVLLLACKGYDAVDQTAGVLGCIFAIGVALFPTTPDGAPSPRQRDIGDVHFICAALLFATFAFFCIRQFTQTGPDPAKSPTPRKKTRNQIYLGCGWTIIGCIVLIGAGHLIEWKGPANWATCLETHVWNFWLESVAVECFGIAWLVKGEFIFEDEPTPHSGAASSPAQPALGESTSNPFACGE